MTAMTSCAVTPDATNFVLAECLGWIEIIRKSWCISMPVTISETERLVEPLSVVRRLLFTLDFHRSSMCQSAGNEQRDVVSSMATAKGSLTPF